MIKDTYSKSSKISCTYLGNLHTEAKHTISVSIIRTDSTKDHDGEVNDFVPTDLLVSSLGTWKDKIYVYKTITS